MSAMVYSVLWSWRGGGGEGREGGREGGLAQKMKVCIKRKRGGSQVQEKKEEEKKD